MPAGRPTKYRETYCAEVIGHMSEGASLTSFAASIGVARDTISEWGRVHAEFSAAVKKGKAKCAAWWEKANRDLALTGKGNATACVFGLKNMAPDEWRDRQQIEHTGKDGGPIATVDLSEDVEAVEKLIGDLARRADGPTLQ